jgi:uncharacterized membrane protein YhaH (DUF805 family)|tara:strand:+ start:293 stop:673 length:381 start_codon:yes stop_codon:yes gene_type:complete
MTFIQSTKTCFQKYVIFNGRASRSEFWWFTLFICLVTILTIIADLVIFGEEMLLMEPYAVVNFTNIFNIFIVLPSLSVTFRRLHDVNKSGWWLLLYFTLIGILVILYWNIKKGNEDENRFGLNPLN